VDADEVRTGVKLIHEAKGDALAAASHRRAWRADRLCDSLRTARVQPLIRHGADHLSSITAINIFPDRCEGHYRTKPVHAGWARHAARCIVSAVETVTSKIPSTIEAAALCKMAERGQITGGLLDGPLAFDNAIDPDVAKIKGIHSPVAGRAQILVVPDLEAGNMLAKNLSFLVKADAAGIVLGARVPIILTSRSDSVRTRMASCAVAVLYADARRRATVLPAA
jgi:phosphate acetyltransferase